MSKYGWVQITEPAREPLTLEEAKMQLRVDHTEEDALILGLITATRQWAERESNRLFITQDRMFTFDSFPCEIRVPFSPVQSVVGITYIDSDGAEQTLGTDQYFLDSYVLPAKIVPAYNITWPSARYQPQSVRVTVRLGEGDYPRDVKENDRAAMKLMLSHLYENREAVVIGAGNVSAELPLGARALLECEPRF
jgi:uncharacterized phiE125 gp8 family phage protein